LKNSLYKPFLAIFLLLMMFSITSVSAWDLLNAQDSIGILGGIL